MIAIVGLFGTIFGALGLSGYLGERARFKAEQRNKRDEEEENEASERKRQRLEESVRNVFKEEIRPTNEHLVEMSAEIKEIKQDLADNTVGTVTILRDRMKQILDDCRDAGFAPTSTKANWTELYNTYRSLGGNHFKEYVDAWKHEMETLPVNPPKKRGRAPVHPTLGVVSSELPVEISLPESMKVDANHNKKGNK